MFDFVSHLIPSFTNIMFFTLGIVTTNVSICYYKSALFRYCVHNPSLIPQLIKVKFNTMNSSTEKLKQVIEVLSPLLQNEEIKDELERYFMKSQKPQSSNIKRKEINRNKMGDQKSPNFDNIINPEMVESLMKNRDIMKLMNDPQLTKVMNNPDIMNAVNDCMKKES